MNYGFHMSDITVHLQNNSIEEVHQNMAEPWNVTLVDTGEATMTGGRMRKIGAYLRPGEDFCFTYGDGVGECGYWCSDTVPQGSRQINDDGRPTARKIWCYLLEGMKVTGFKEKPKGDGAYVNAGFFVLSESVIEYVGGTTRYGRRNRWRSFQRAVSLWLSRIAVLATDGHHERQGDAGRPVAKRFGTLEELVKESFWQDKRVLITGHTGFKGTWLSVWLESLGAKTYGFAKPADPVSMYEIVRPTIEGECLLALSELDELSRFVVDNKIEVVFHLAAQALVQESYVNPIETYNTNVMGTLNVLEAIRHAESVRCAVIVTTDKCYENSEWNGDTESRIRSVAGTHTATLKLVVN